MLTTTLSMSERLACKAVGLARSTYRRLLVAQTPADPVKSRDVVYDVV
jgi:putative transposase